MNNLDIFFFTPILGIIIGILCYVKGKVEHEPMLKFWGIICTGINIIPFGLQLVEKGIL